MMRSIKADPDRPTRTAITRGELYAIVAGTLLLIGTAALVLNGDDNARTFLRTPAGAGIAAVITGVIALPATRILARAYYGVEDAAAGKLIVWTLVAAAAAVAVQWVFRP
jgi:hypothetical protein